jgi:chromosome segregation ATPase
MELSEIFTVLEGLDNGKQLIEGVKAKVSGLNSEAESLRKQRNQLLGHVGIDSASGVNIETINQRLEQIKAEQESQRQEAERKMESERKKKESTMTDYEKLQAQLQDMAKGIEDRDKRLAEKERAERISNLNSQIRNALSAKGVDPVLIDDLAESIKALSLESSVAPSI